jgi:hypothetical protein
MALAIAPPVLLAQERDHDQDRDQERGKVNDPTGVWLQRSMPVILITFHSDGTYSADVQGESAFLPGNESPGFQLTSAPSLRLI